MSRQMRYHDLITDLIGNESYLTDLMASSTEDRAVTASSPRFKQAMKELTGKPDPTYQDILDMLLEYGLSLDVAGQYATHAIDGFEE